MSRANPARLLMVLATLLVISACNKTAPVDTAADNAALLSVAESFSKAYNDKNADLVAATYTNDAQLLPPDAPAISGNSDIRAHYADDIANHWMQLTINTGESGVAGDWGWRSGTWSVGATPDMTGKYVEVWRRTTDGWRIYRDIWNSDAAAPAMAPAAPAAPAAQ